MKRVSSSSGVQCVTKMTSRSERDPPFLSLSLSLSSMADLEGG
jgi:hypothetical protein